MSRKRKLLVTDEETKTSKRICMDVNVTSNEDLQLPSDLQNKSRQIKLNNNFNRNIPHHLIGFIYRLDLSVLCLLRKFKYEHKYPTLSLTFEDSEIEPFSNIILRDQKSIHIHIEIVDKYIDNDISYVKLFSKGNKCFSINNYFNSFVKYITSKLDGLSSSIEHLVVYTNADLGVRKKFERGRSKKNYLVKFDGINIEEFGVLKDFLFIDNTQGFYRFSQDKPTREELLKRLEFSSAVQEVMKEKKLHKFQKEMKEAFLDKLVFAVNQPNREELNSIIKNEMERNNEVRGRYITLQKNILRDLEKNKKLGNYIPGIMYEFNLLMLFLHDMFLHKRMLSINFDVKNEVSHEIIINYKDKVTYIKAYNPGGNIGYSQLFPSKKREKNMFTINKYFTIFIEKLKEDIKYFIIYTNVDLDLEENRLRKGQSKGFYPLKFDNIDIESKRFKILRDFSCINRDGLYQFSGEEATREKLLGLLTLPSFLQKAKVEGTFSDRNEKEIKELFLDKLILMVNQPNRKSLNRFIRNEIDNSEVPYNYEELHEVVLRWLESHDVERITKGIMENFLEDIKNNRSSHQEIRNKVVVIKFAGSVVGKKGTSTFDQFLAFLIKGEGKKYLEVLKKQGINLSSISSILHGSGKNATKAFEDLYNLWFDVDGNKTRYLKAIEKEGISLSNVSSILHGARGNAAEAFKDLYHLWFDACGGRTRYLKSLENEGINLTNMSGILSGTGTNAGNAFKELYDLWFDPVGNKTQYLKSLEEEGIDLRNVSSILSGVGSNAAKVFRDLYDLWFDSEGNKTQYLKILEKEGINLGRMSSILHRARVNAVEAFKELYDLWFDSEGNKTQYLKTLENEGISLGNISSILGGAGSNAAKAFKDLYDLWFDGQGNKSEYLKILKKEKINLGNVSSILLGAGVNAPKAFKELYNLWFESGNKTRYLKTLKKERINLSNMSSILHGSGANAANAFKDLHDLWFDSEGNKTKYLESLEKNGINLITISSILHQSRANAAKAFKDLYRLWFNAEGRKTQYLTVLEKEGIDLGNICSILGGTGINATKAFTELYDLWFDEDGNKKRYLEHFIQRKVKSFTLYNLSSILAGTGVKVNVAFVKLHNVCFDNDGNPTELLYNFYAAGFKPSNISCILCKTGVRASSLLRRLHSVCFSNNGNRTKVLDDFFNAGFKPRYLCSILSGSADSIEKFHNFCFVDDTKKYLNHFFNEGFTPKDLSNIFHGSRSNICWVLKDFYNVCFMNGKRTGLLNDFYEAGFRLSDLSGVLCMSGNNASNILMNFHELCFKKGNYLNHFLSEKELFTQKNLSKILLGVGINISSIFEKLYDLCFDKSGNKTEYLNNLIENNPSNEIFNILYKKVKNVPFLDE